MKKIYLMTLLMTITSTAFAADYSKQCPGINDVESLAGQQCYTRLSCNNDANGAPVYSVKVFIKNNEQVAASAASDNLPVQRDRIAKHLASLMLTQAADDVLSSYADAAVKACASLVNNQSSEANTALIGFLAGLKSGSELVGTTVTGLDITVNKSAKTLNIGNVEYILDSANSLLGVNAHRVISSEVEESITILSAEMAADYKQFGACQEGQRALMSVMQGKEGAMPVITCLVK